MRRTSTIYEALYWALDELSARADRAAWRYWELGHRRAAHTLDRFSAWLDRRLNGLWNLHIRALRKKGLLK